MCTVQPTIFQLPKVAMRQICSLHILVLFAHCILRNYPVFLKEQIQKTFPYSFHLGASLELQFLAMGLPIPEKTDSSPQRIVLRFQLSHLDSFLSLGYFILANVLDRFPHCESHSY